MKSTFFTVACLLAVSTAAVADDAQNASTAFKAANDKMMQNMMMAPSGNADKDFIKMMTPHHEGAIDMAKIELQYGKDPELRAMAQSIIDAQQKEIQEMKDWMAKNP